MKKKIRKISTKSITSFIVSKLGSRIFQLLSSISMEIIEKVNHNSVNLKLVCPNRFAYWRAKSFPTIGFILDELISTLKLPLPDYLKIDVDGIEHFILEGANKTLKNIKEIHIEINDDFNKQEKVCKELSLKSGFSLKDKLRSDIFDGSDFSNSYNQTWVKK